jgi:hypothetical protein
MFEPHFIALECKYMIIIIFILFCGITFTRVRIFSELHLSDTTSEFSTVVIIDSASFRIHMYIHDISIEHISHSNGLLVVVIKPKTEYTLYISYAYCFIVLLCMERTLNKKYIFAKVCYCTSFQASVSLLLVKFRSSAVPSLRTVANYKFDIGVASSGIMFMSRFLKISQLVTNLEKVTHRQHGNLIRSLSFLEGKYAKEC